MMDSARLMLNEIQSESLQRLLSSVSYKTSPPGLTHISALDEHLFSVTQRRVSALSSVNREDVLEIQGPPSSGKTHLLYHLLITCILPSSHLSFNIGGWEKAAIVFDTDATFDLCRLNQLIVSRLMRLLSVGTSATLDTAKEVAKRSLENLHIFRPTSSIQLAATIIHLPAYHSTQMPYTEIGLVAVDSISAFYWQDRFTVEQMRSAPIIAQPGKLAPSFVSPLQHVLTALQNFRLAYGPVIVLTNWGLIPLAEPPSASISATPFYRQHLHPFPSPFNPSNPNAARAHIPVDHSSCDPANPLPLTHHITTACTTLPPIDSGISLEEARAQCEQRQTELMEKGEAVGIIRTPGSTSTGSFVLRISKTEMTND